MSIETIEIAALHCDVLRFAKENADPRECCGVLFGVRDDKRLIVSRVINTINAASTNSSFAIPNHEMRRVRLLAALANMDIIAVFHSHPSGSTELSRSDQAALAHSEWPWVIVTQNPTTRELLLTLYQAPCAH